MNRKEYWLSKGYTKEQIENHLKFERYKNKKSRERKKINNENNKKLIKQIKSELIGEIFKTEYYTIKILSINPTTDGVGFWYKIHKVFKDSSEGNFRYFYYFDDYTKKEFLKYLINS